ncbi:hypothetical protein [Aromatoleum toluclasticum]|uniref:hypothetical protein n=1 Tax=Aromatoleum toluclasticum TaxID=92003 RepID=UPI0003726723|nr:hypothetical protein [Aromatoleum toluclasticum]
MLRIVGGTIVAIIGYAIGRRLLDAAGLENRFNSRIWRYTVSQFGEVILAIFTIGAVVIGAGALGLVRGLLD